MSLIVDPDYLIHSLRLSYLKCVDDIHGPRILTLPSVSSAPAGASAPALSAGANASLITQPFAPDSHVVVAGLTNPNLHPEINTLHSPVPTSGPFAHPRDGQVAFDLNSPEDNIAGPSRLPSGKGGPGLRYTQTIYGPGRTGAVGMRVSGKRAPSVDALTPSHESIAFASKSPGEANGSRSLAARRAAGISRRSNSNPLLLSSTSNARLVAFDGLSPTAREPPSVPHLEVLAATADEGGPRHLSQARSFQRRNTQTSDTSSASPSGGRLQELSPKGRTVGKGNLPVISIPGEEDAQTRQSLQVSDGEDASNSPAASGRTSASPSGPSSDVSPMSDSAMITAREVSPNTNPFEESLERHQQRDSALTVRGVQGVGSGTASDPTPLTGRRRSASEGTSGLLGRSIGAGLPANGPFLRSLNGSSGPHGIRSTAVGLDEMSDDDSPAGAIRPLRLVDGMETSDEEDLEGTAGDDSMSNDAQGTVDGFDSDEDTSRATWRATLSRAESDGTVFSLASVPPSTAPAAVGRRRSAVTSDGTPLGNKHFFTPVADLDGPHFPFPALSQTSPNRQVSEVSPQPSFYEAPVSPMQSRHQDADSGAAQAEASGLGEESELMSSVGSVASSSVPGSPSSFPAVHSPPPPLAFLSEAQPGILTMKAISPHAQGATLAEGIVGSLVDSPASARPSPSPALAGGLGLDTGDALIDLSDSAPATARPVSPSQHRGENQKALDQSKDQRGRLNAANRHAGSNGLPRTRSRSQMRTKAQNEWFASLKTDPSTIASRHSQPKVSALSALLRNQSSGVSNAFAAFYAGIAGRADSHPSTTVELYFPFAVSGQQQPASGSKLPSGALSVDTKAKSMKLCVRKDATMEELIGYGLYCYVEEGWAPKLDEGVSGDERDIKLSTIGWTLRIVEDGEVDDDYPAIDRSLTVGKFGGDEFAICEASAAQIKQHEAAQGGIQRRAGTGGDARSNSNALQAPGAAGKMLPPPGTAGGMAAAAGKAPAGSLISVHGTPIFASSALSRSAMGPTSASIFLRVLVTPNSEVRYKTTINVPSDMYLADVLELICRKRQLAHADEWALVVPDKDIVVPLDRTVESLQGNHDLALVRRSTLGAQGGAGALTGQSTNPNASIFKRLSEPVQPKYNTAMDFTSAYKKYTVNRKMPMFVGRHERVLTLDGDWVHIMPSDSRAFQTKAASFHITSVVSCKQSRKVPSHFKLVVWRETPRDTKRYDFEAENGRQAAEIIQEVQTLKRLHSRETSTSKRLM